MPAVFLTCLIVSLSSVMNSMAPMRYSAFLVLTPEYLRSEEKAIISVILGKSSVRRFLGLFRKVFFKAVMVAFSAVWLVRMASRAARNDFSTGVGEVDGFS